ncbi:MAG: glycosyltransferase family 2 protein, partial [Hungatella sp.]
MNREIRLSQCMIVKNEEKNMERALSWGREIMYEQIVVDTGSTDQTVEIAKRMGAKVFHFPWIDDFSAAKNYAIEQARGNWIAFLDADESYSKQDADKIPGILHDIEQNFNAKTKPHMIRSAMLCLRDDGTVLASYFQDRIFRNLNHLRYHNRVHEALGFPLGVSDPLIYYDATKDLTILHTGYTASTYQDTDKAERDIQLLRMELEKNPNDVMLLRYLGDALNSVGRQEEAESIYERAVELGIANMPQDAGPWILYNLMQHIYTRNNPEEELKLQQRYEQAEELAEGYPDFNYIMGLWFARRGDASRTIC